MKLREKMKRFWTLDVHNHEGFTLVELIIVIAILAILSTGAIAGYSVYVEQANMTADKTLIAEIENVLMLANYSGDLNEDGYIKLGANGVVNAADINADIAAALQASYGDGWQTALKLKYDGWLGMTSDQIFAAAYEASSYKGNEDALIGQLGSVTNMLKDALGANTGLVGTSFNNYLTGAKVDTSDNQAVANAAILYAADTVGKLDTDSTNAVNAAFSNFYNPSSAAYGDMTSLTLTLKTELGIYGAVAAIYAHGEAFGQYVAANGNSELLEDFHAIDASTATDTEAALTQVANNLGIMVDRAKNDANINPFALQYIQSNQYANDVTAYLEAMKKIDANADKFSGNLGSADCYTDGTAASLLQAAVAAGKMNISCNNGEVVIWISNGIVDNTVTGIQD